MGWSKGYYYSKGQYIGGGETGLLVEKLDKARRRDAERKRARIRAVTEQDRQAFQEARQGADRADKVATWGLTSAGFHKRARHNWQRNRKAGAMQQPAVIEGAVCELAELVQTSYVARIFGKDRDLERRLHNKLENLRAELLGTDPSPALRLAAELVAHCYVDYWTVEMIASGRPEQVSPTLERRRNWALQRYTRALATLSKIGRPRAPLVAIQVVQESQPCQHIPSPNIPTNSMLSEH
jgi:hypothetical protein